MSSLWEHIARDDVCNIEATMSGMTLQMWEIDHLAFKAAEQGSIKVVYHLLDHYDIDLNTIVMGSIYNTNIDLLKDTIERGADEFNEFLGAAALSGCYDIVCFLINTHHAVPGDDLLPTVLKEAHIFDTRIIKMLLGGRKIEPRVLMEATTNSDANHISQWLLSEHNISHKDLVFILHTAMDYDNTEMVEFLLTTYEFTPAELTLQLNEPKSREIGKILVKHGANINAFTPKDVCILGGNDDFTSADILELLRADVKEFGRYTPTAEYWRDFLATNEFSFREEISDPASIVMQYFTP